VIVGDVNWKIGCQDFSDQNCPERQTFPKTFIARKYHLFDSEDPLKLPAQVLI
jgi:hypothetical protein